MPADWQQLGTAGTLVVAVDLDGTLVPFADTPHEAVVSSDTLGTSFDRISEPQP